MDIKIENYLSNEEIKEILIQEVKDFANKELENFKKQEIEENRRIESNLVYEIIGDFVNKEILNSEEYQETIKNEVKEHIKDGSTIKYEIFCDGYYGKGKGAGLKIIESAVKENQDIIKKKVKQVLENFDYETLTIKEMLNVYKGCDE